MESLVNDMNKMDLSDSNEYISEEFRFKILKNYFEEKGIVRHQVDTFNDFINNGIQRVVKECDIIVNNKDSKYSVSFGDIFIPKPSLIEEDRSVRHFFPQEARTRDLTYDSPIFVDIVEKIEVVGQSPEINTHRRVMIARTPIMLNCDKCNLNGLTKNEKIKTGECEWDQGGYFIIKGKERVLVGQLRGVYNQPIVLSQKPGDKYKFVCESRSMSEETGHSVLIQIKISERSVVMTLPNIKEVINVGIVIKAMGFVTEEEIIDIIGLYDPATTKYIRYIVRDSYFIKTREDALNYIGQFATHVIKDDKRVDYALQIVENEILPHMGISSTLKEKAYYIGSMINKLIRTNMGMRNEDDRDNYINKRVEMAGVLCCDLFRALFKRFVKSIQMQIEKKKQHPDIVSMISRATSITLGLRQSFAIGAWGIQKNNYVRTGVSQVLSRMTHGAVLSHLRRVVIPIGKEGKNAKIRQIHASQINYICPCECFDPETPILTWDGKIKLAKDIKIGDVLIDDNGNPTKVRKTISGVAPMYNVITDKPDFMNHTVTSNHILTLRVTEFHEEIISKNIQIDKDNVIDVNIDTFKTFPEYIQKSLKIFKYVNDTAIKKFETNFSIKEKDLGEFVGWQVEGNGRFLLSDRTVVHNTPEGQSIGIVLNLALLTTVTRRIPTVVVKEIVENSENLIFINDYKDKNDKPKVFLNGVLMGIAIDAKDFIDEMKTYRSDDLLHKDVSFTYDSVDNEIRIYSDEGRFTRPVFTVNDDNKLNITEKDEPIWEKLVENQMIQYVDNSEVENSVIAMDDKDLQKFKCNFQEIHPSMMLGIMGSSIPFPDHSQSPRNLYQCLCPTTKVLLTNGGEKEIKDIKIGDEVITFDPETLETSHTKVVHQYVRETKNDIYKITTMSGREIIATSNHNFMTNKGWKSVDNMIKDKDIKIGVLLSPKPMVNNIKNRQLILSSESMFEILNGKIKSSLLELHINKLEKCGLLPLYNDYRNIHILARMYGFLCTDGSINIYDKKNGGLTPQCQFDFSTEIDSKMFEEDVERCGIQTCTPYESIREYNGSIYHTWKVSHNGELPSLFIALGISYGEKTETYKNPVPDWIINGSDIVKREFISGFQGGDGCQIRFNKMKSGSNNFVCAETSQSINPKYLESMDNFFRQCVDILTYFKVEVKFQKPVKYEENRYRFAFKISDSIENLIHFYETIGYRYCYYKIVLGGKVVEYLKHKTILIDDYVNFIKNVRSEIDNGKSNSEIAKKYKKKTSNISDIRRSYLDGRAVSAPTLKHNVQDFIDMFEDKALSIFVPIESIEKVPNQLISDITVESDNHSFIAAFNFLSSNSSMGKQAIGMFSQAHKIRTDTITHVLDYPQKPLVNTTPAGFLGFNDMPAGVNVIVAIACYGGFNQEDSVIINKSAVDRGLFVSTSYRTLVDEEKKQGTYNYETIELPPMAKRKRNCNYSFLNERGIVQQRINGKAVYVEKGDVIIGKTLTKSNKNGEEEQFDCSFIIKSGEEGYIDRVIETMTPNGYKMVKVVIRNRKIPEIGDKFASRAA